MSIRSVWSSRWVWLTALSLGLVACGGAQEPSRPTGPVKKVAWDDSEAEPASEAAVPEAEDQASTGKAAESEDEDPGVGGNVIDLDAPVAKAAPKPAPSPAPEPEPPAVAAEEEEAEEEEPAAKAEPEPESPSNDPLAAELRKRRAQAKARSDAKKETAAPKKTKKKGKAAAAEGEETAASYKGADPCRAASFSVSRVREACATGGRAAAKRVMKDAIGKATATGQPLKCSNCHSNQRDYALKDDAVAELERWLASSSS